MPISRRLKSGRSSTTRTDTPSPPTNGTAGSVARSGCSLLPGVSNQPDGDPGQDSVESILSSGVLHPLSPGSRSQRGCPDTGPARACYAPAGAGASGGMYCQNCFESAWTVSTKRAPTIGGWAPGRSKLTSEGLSVTPYNSATAALYTYTPWVLTGTGGNWLFWNVFGSSWPTFWPTVRITNGLEANAPPTFRARIPAEPVWLLPPIATPEPIAKISPPASFVSGPPSQPCRCRDWGCARPRVPSTATTAQLPTPQPRFVCL